MIDEAVEQEKVADLYGEKYLRESEIRTVHALLESHPVVMVMGSLGRGKSTFIYEAAQYTREMKKHGRFARSTYVFDVHELDRHVRLNLDLFAKQSTVEDIAKSAHPVLDWLDHQPVGQRLEDIPPSERSILYLDAGDALFLEHLGTEYYPAYKSPAWKAAEDLKDNPEALQLFLKTFIEGNRINYQRAMTAAGRTSRINEPEAAESIINSLLNNFPKYQAFEETRDLLFNKIAQALQDGRIRVVLTDHDYSRESMKKSGDGIHRQASLYMLEKYDHLFTDAYKYDLPADLQIDKARLFLRRKLSLTDPGLQSEIIAATNAEYKLLKLAITPEVLRALQSIESEEHRLRILQRATEPFQTKP